jgi:thiol-disulfide isomerase/thioredoxin
MKKLLTILAVVLSTSIFAGEKLSFTEDKFNELQSSNASILVDVHAGWCSTCKKQSSIIDMYLDEHPESNLTVLSVDVDEQEEWVKHFKARKSTLILYKGKKEIERSMAQTDKEKLYKLFKKAM